MKNLKFSSQLLACVVLPSLLFVAALAAGLGGLWQTRSEYVDAARQQAIAGRLQQMLAQGLAAGQGVRDLALDPSNRVARAGIPAGHQQAAELLAQSVQLAAGTDLADALARIEGMQSAHARLQRDIVQLIRDKPGEVIQAIVERETPSWTALRGELSRLVALADERAQQAGARAEAASESAAAWAAALACAAAAAAVVLCFVLQRALRRELGGEPELARRELLRVAEGDLRVDALASSPPTHSMLGVVHQRQSALRAMVARVHDVTSDVGLVAGEIATGNQTLSERTEQTAQRLEAATASLSQLTERIDHVSAVATQASGLAGSANSVATQGGAVVHDVVQTMAAISASSQQVAEIVGIIEGIAFQTNLLALNASVEAARAGEQGRGFAVVADEVRTLASRSHQAARQIKELIERSAAEVQDGTERVEAAGRTMHEIVEATRRVSGMMETLSRAAGEQAGHIASVNGTVSAVEGMTRQNAALVEESAVVSERLKAQADELSRIVGSFRVSDAPASAY